MIGPGPYRATKLWNEIIKLFSGGMPLKRHWVHFRMYDNSFTGSEAVDWLHELLKRNHNFGPEVTRYQTLQLLRKFLKNHVFEDIKGRFGKEDFEDNGQVYRFPPSSPLKPLPQRPSVTESSFLPKLPNWDNYEKVLVQENIPMKPLVLNSESWNKRHSIAIGEVHECKLIRRREITQKQVDQIWKSMTLAHLQRVLGLESLEGVLDARLINPKHIVQNVYSVNKQGVVVLKDKSGPNSGEMEQAMYPGFEKDVLRTVADFFQKLQEPLLTFQLYEVFVNILGLLQKQQAASDALQVCSLLLPPANRRKLQLLMRLMSCVCHNPCLPTLNDAIGTRTLMVQTFSRCILRSTDEVDLDDLLATKLVNFMLDSYEDILRVPTRLQRAVEEHLTHLRRVKIKYAGTDADSLLSSPSYRRQISKEEFEEQKANSSQGVMVELLEGIIKDKELSVKDKKQKLKQFQRSYPEIYRKHFPTAESEGAVLTERPPRLKPQLMFLALKKPFQPFQRSWSFRA